MSVVSAENDDDGGGDPFATAKFEFSNAFSGL